MENSATPEILSDEPAGERWDPLGAPNDEDDNSDKHEYQCDQVGM